MKNLNKRQIIILIITALFVLYAAYDFLIAQPAAKRARIEAQPVEIETFINTLSKDLMKDKVAGVDTYVAGRAEMAWGKSPFWERASYREFAGSESGSGEVAKIIYSGYVDTGRKKMAIINGWEYEVGESLEIDGYVLKSVAPSRVLIVNRNTGGELYVPIQE